LQSGASAPDNERYRDCVEKLMEAARHANGLESDILSPLWYVVHKRHIPSVDAAFIKQARNHIELVSQLVDAIARELKQLAKGQD
jgi:hypothetical protein